MECPKQELGSLPPILAVSLLLGHVLGKPTEPGFSIGEMETQNIVHGDIGNHP